MECALLTRPSLSHNEKRKMLLRSTGSFSIIEDNIIVPTPRKIPNIACSPKLGRRDRRDKSSDEKLFGEAGFEIQNILFQPQSQKPLPISQVLSDDVVMNSPMTIALNHDVHSAPLKFVTVLRAANPITMNSPFHMSEEVSHRPSFARTENVGTAAQINPRLYPANGRHTRGSGHTRKELNRGRSFSWPGVPKNFKKSEKS